jgi:sugar phosphate isomerase/epimerase
MQGTSMMRLGLYGAILHDRSLPDAIQVVANVGLTGLEINTGGFLPAVAADARLRESLES